MAKKKTIEEMVDSLYEDQEVIDTILASIKEHNTADRILSGELVLPGKQDALHHMLRITGRLNETEETREAKARIAELEKQFKALADSLQTTPTDDYVTKLEQRVALLEGKK